MLPPNDRGAGRISSEFRIPIRCGAGPNSAQCDGQGQDVSHATGRLPLGDEDRPVPDDQADVPLARLLSMPAFPLTPTLLPFPLPTRYHLWFGEPMRFTGPADDEDAVLEEKVARVKEAIQALIARGLRERPGIFR